MRVFSIYPSGYGDGDGGLGSGVRQVRTSARDGLEIFYDVMTFTFIIPLYLYYRDGGPLI